METITIPLERVGALIGKNGETKQLIENTTQTRLEIDGKTGVISAENTGNDPLGEYKATEIVRAVGRGFSPQKALMLENEENVLEIIELSEHSKTKHDQERIKGRIIGEQGKTREYIETTTKTALSVYGKTISMIGKPENLLAAKHAISLLVKGKPHYVVYQYLDRNAHLLA